MKSNVITVGSILLAIVLLVAMCRSKSVTKKHLEYGDDLNDAIEKFEKDRREFTTELNTLTNETSSDLKQEDESVAGIAEDWEKRWNDLNGKLDKLNKDFLRVGKSSSEYFLNLENLAADIRDEAIQKEETIKNEELKGQWTRAYQDAAQSLKKIEQVMYDGNDFYKVLVASSIRQQVKSDIKELESITIRALALLDELEEFAKEGKKLINNG